MARKKTGRATGRPKAKQARVDAQPDYPFLVWPYGGDSGAHGFAVTFPDLPAVEASRALNLDDAMKAAFAARDAWLTSRPESKRPPPASFSDGIHPGAPTAALTSLQAKAVTLEVQAILCARESGSRRKRRGFGWVRPEDLLAMLNRKRGDSGDVRTIVLWRSLPHYKAAVLAALRDAADEADRAEAIEQRKRHFLPLS